MAKNLESFISKFESYLITEKRYSLHTSTAYINDCKQFFLFTNHPLPTPLEPTQITDIEAKAWIYQLKIELGNDNKTIRRKITSLRMFYKFLMKEQIIETNPFLLLKTPKIAKRVSNFISETDLGTLIDIHFEQSLLQITEQEKLCVLILYSTGIRLSELINLQWQSIDLSNRTLSITGKGNKMRKAPLTDELLIILRNCKENINPQSTDYLITTKKGEKSYPVMIQRIVKKLLSLISTESKLSPHILRHSFATHLLNRGADINAIKELLGHSSLKATEIYTHTTIESLRNIYKSSHPKS